MSTALRWRADCMLVAHDLLFLHPRMAGVRVYATNLVDALLRDPVSKDWEHVLYVSQDGVECLSDRARAADLRIMPVLGRQKVSKLWWQQWHLPRLAADAGADVIHCYDYVIPLGATVPTVMTVHDVRYLDHQSKMGFSARNVRRALVPLGLRRASALATVSRLTLDQLRQRFDVPGIRTAVIPDAPEPLHHEPPDASVLARFSIRRPYVLAVGTVSSHKNYGALLEAFAALNMPELSLVIAGRPSPLSAELAAQASRLGVGERVIFTGFTEKRALAALFRGASVFAMPSRFEGFGIPVLEAMQFDVPVASSTAGALREVAGDAARYFDPTDVSAMTAALRDVLTSDDLRAQLVAAGRRRLEEFTWERSAAEQRELLLAVTRSTSAG